MADNNQTQPQQPQHEELVKGVVGLFHTISGNKTRIVYTNFFTGKIHVQNGGFFINFPWRVRPVTVSLDQQKVDTAERITHTASTGTATGPTVSYDTDYFLKIVDPAKFVESAESMSASAVRKNIGDMLDQRIRDYIITQDYATLMGHGAINFAAQLAMPGPGGAPSLADQIRDDYGVEVRNIMFRVKPPKALIDEANKTALAQQATRTATEEQNRRRIEAQGQADVTRITAEAEAKKAKAEGAALAANMEKWIRAGMTNEQIAQKLANEALTNGTNPNTVVIANAAQNAAGSNPGFDMAAMMSLFNAMMNQRQQQMGGAPVAGSGQPVVQQQVQAQPVSTAEPAVDWDTLNDDEYLTAEDSLALATERKAKLMPGGRYHISLLTDKEKERYVVASQKGRTK